MSGGDYTYNRFEQFEKSLLEGKECKKCGPDCDCDSCKGKKSKKGAKPDYLDLDKDGDKEEDMEDAAEGMSEGIDFKGAKRIDDARAKKQAEKDKKNPSGKDYRLALRKFRPGASNEERAEGHRDNMREKGTSPIKNGKKMFEDAYAAVYAREEIEHLEERLDDMPAGDVGHEIHKKAMKANQSAIDAVNMDQKASDKKHRNSTKSLKKEALEATGLFTSEEIEHIGEVLGLGKN